MSELGDAFRGLNAYHKERKRKNLAAADSDGWNKHTEYHWWRMLNGKKLDYWPSRNKFMYDGCVMVGDVGGFIRNREKKDVDS